jgi:hypothetical protein
MEYLFQPYLGMLKFLCGVLVVEEEPLAVGIMVEKEEVVVQLME